MTPKSSSNPECGEETDSSIIGKYGHFSASSTDISYLEQYATLNMHIRVQLAVQALLAAQVLPSVYNNAYSMKAL